MQHDKTRRFGAATSHTEQQAHAELGNPRFIQHVHTELRLSRDGRRIYLTNSLYSPWDAQFYPDGIRGWAVKLDAAPEGGIAFDPNFFVEFEDGLRPHQIRLQGGDASSDSFCYA